MRLTALAGLFACIVIMNVGSPKVSAEEPDSFELGSSQSVNPAKSLLAVLDTIETNNKKLQEQQITVEEVESKEPKTHVISPNETLSDIASTYETTWQRIYAKNVDIDDPNTIKVGVSLVIPEPNEDLLERPLPVPPAPQPAAPVRNRAAASSPATVQQPVQQVAVPRASSSGNTYTQGYCTWYAKAKRPDLPNNLGNANTWVARARAQGIATGSTPRVGAIGQQGMHVVYIEQVNDDGTVLVSEMNYKGLYIVSTRVVPASNFQYIY